MKPQAFQPGELRDEYDQIIRAGAYGKKTPFVNSDNSAILDYIMNNFDALYAQIPNGRAYVKSVNNITPDSNGNVTVNVGSGGGIGTNITVDTTLSSTSTNPVQNKVIYAALNNKLDKNGTATYAARDSSGNIISSTYARKSELSSYVKSINNVKPDSAGNVNISTGGGGTGTNITVDTTLSSTSNNAIANKTVYAALNNKLDKTGTAAYAHRDSTGNVITETYAKKADISGVVKSVNGTTPDSSGNVNISTSGGGSNVTVDSTLSANSTNPVQNKVITAALNSKANSSALSAYLPLAGGTCTGGVSAPNFQTGEDASSFFQCRKFRGQGDANTYYHAVDFGYSGHDGVDFYEYDPNWNFYKCTTGQKSGAVLVGNINGNGWNGGARLTGAPTAPTATAGTNNTQIATTAFVQQALAGVVKSVNNITPDSNGNVTITVSGGTGGNIPVDSALSSTSTNAIQNRVVQQEFTSVRAAIPTKVSQLTNDSGYLTQHQSLDGYVKTSGQNTWRALQTFNLATLGYEQYTTPNSSTSSISPSTSAASYYATGAFTLNLSTLSALLGSNQSTVFSAYITAGGDYALSITNGGTVKYIGEASDVAITSAGLLLNILMTKDNYGKLTSIVQANKLT
ncbi:hypothetical protein [Phascolarctobacterium succinatutens]|uniref:hypothetical protein n=1 Tax=Phascolarctobacterium succinatutens TaxID=626940 RepID=UPI0040268002